MLECRPSMWYDSQGRRTYKKVTTNGSVTLHHRYIYRGYLQIACIDLSRSHHPTLWLITCIMLLPVVPHSPRWPSCGSCCSGLCGVVARYLIRFALRVYLVVKYSKLRINVQHFFTFLHLFYTHFQELTPIITYCRLSVFTPITSGRGLHATGQRF